MILAELRIKLTGEFEQWEKLEDKIDDAFTKLESYAEQLFSEEWAKELNVELDN